MSIKCTERTEANARKDIPQLYSQRSYTRFLQLRKRSLTSMGWRYHV